VEEAVTNKPIRLLIADDDHSIREQLRDLLDREPDIEVVAAVSDGATALTLTRALLPDVVVLDERMPGARGWEVAVALSREGSATRIVIYSAESEVRGWADTLTSVDFVAKDERFDVLLATIRAAAPQPRL
jgi:DNA-binding NarL/FixJ family response regulator